MKHKALSHIRWSYNRYIQPRIWSGRNNSFRLLSSTCSHGGLYSEETGEEFDMRPLQKWRTRGPRERALKPNRVCLVSPGSNMTGHFELQPSIKRPVLLFSNNKKPKYSSSQRSQDDKHQKISAQDSKSSKLSWAGNLRRSHQRPQSTDMRHWLRSYAGLRDPDHYCCIAFLLEYRRFIHRQRKTFSYSSNSIWGENL